MSLRMYEKEIWSKVTELTAALCRVANKFSGDEILKSSLKEQALIILKLTSLLAGATDKKMEEDRVTTEILVMYSYLKVSGGLGLTNPLNLDVLRRGYEDLENMIRVECLYAEPESKKGPNSIEVFSSSSAGTKKSNIDKPSEFKKATEVASPEEVLNERQRKILEHLQIKQTAKVSDFFTMFSGLSPKTIPRDLQNLVKRNILIKAGKKRWTTYTLVNVL